MQLSEQKGLSYLKRVSSRLAMATSVRISERTCLFSMVICVNFKPISINLSAFIQRISAFALKL